MSADPVMRLSTQPVQVTAGRVGLDGDLTVPDGAIGVVLFAHGSGSSRHSPRNQMVARALQEAGLATLLFDLLTPAEERVDVQTAELRFDIGLLAERLVGATGWIEQHPSTQGLPVGYFGASTGGGAALLAAAEDPASVRAVVSRGGRPDLAGAALPRVQAPTLLLVGGRDELVIALNRAALAELGCEKALVVVPGATHLFEEAGTLEEVAKQARDWFVRHLPVAADATGRTTRGRDAAGGSMAAGGSPRAWRGP
ncbi:MAG: alpha/beta family hydrolase [Chloroflexota bacterium]